MKWLGVSRQLLSAGEAETRRGLCCLLLSFHDFYPFSDNLEVNSIDGKVIIYRFRCIFVCSDFFLIFFF